MDFSALYVPQFHAHLNSHDSFESLEMWFRKLHEAGVTSVATTEHGNMGHVMKFRELAKRYGMRAHVGLEAYVKNTDNPEDKKVYHITLLALNYNGYKNLVKINNDQKHSGRATSFSFILEHSDDIVVLSGCPSSIFQQHTYPSDLLYRFAEKLGDRFYIEAQLLDVAPNHYKRALELSALTGAKIILTNDAHYFSRGDHEIHFDLMRALKAMNESASGIYKQNWYIYKAEEYLERLDEPWVRQAILDTIELEKRFEEYEIRSEQKLETFKNDAIILENMCFESNRYNPAHRERVLMELAAINNVGFNTYFLILKDVVDYCEKNNIAVGPGRGSAAGSYVAYLLGITDINPIQYGLYFERFMNPKRAGAAPDIDTDIASERRPEIVAYMEKKYSAKQIAAYGSLSLKTIILYAKKMRTFGGIPTADWAKLDSIDSPEDPVVDWFFKQYPVFENFYNNVVGRVRNISTHAGGFGLMNAASAEICPMDLTPDGRVVVAFPEGQGVEDAANVGVLKLDLLGITALDIIQMLYELTGVKAPLPEPNKVYSWYKDIFHLGNTTGIFQFSGGGITEFTKKAKPRVFEDLIAITSVYRKGPLQAGTGDAYNRAVSLSEPRKLHPMVDDTLAPTMGLIIYQETIMELYAVATGKDFADGDIARRALIKYNPNNPKSVALYEQVKSEMINGFVSKGMPKSVAEQIWSEIATHVAYSFNKSHAAAYSMISHIMAWYKQFFPMQFFAASLQYRPEKERMQFILDISRLGIKISNPDINLSRKTWFADDKAIYMPLDYIKGVGPKAVDEIIAKRPFIDAEDFSSRVSSRAVNSRTIAKLFSSGALSSLSTNPEDFGITQEYVNENSTEIFSTPTPNMRRLELAENAKRVFAGMNTGKKKKVVVLYGYLLENPVIGAKSCKLTFTDNLVVWIPRAMYDSISNHIQTKYGVAFKKDNGYTIVCEATERGTRQFISNVYKSLEEYVIKWE